MALSFYTTHSGALFVSPGGQSEGGPQMKAAGYAWGAINIVDGHGWDEWATTRSSLEAAGLRHPVWGRVQNAGAGALDGLENLLTEGVKRHSPVIANIEDEFKSTTPAAFEKKIRAVKAANPTWTREVVINTVGWLYNDVLYTPIAHRPVQLQVMVDDMHIAPSDLPHVVTDCIQHARLKGFRDIGVTFQSFGAAEPTWYAFWPKPRSLFTGDIVGAKSAWAQWAVAT